MNLFQLQIEVRPWSAHNFPNKKPYQPLLGAGEELGELMHAFLKHEQGIRGVSEMKARAAMEDAIGDTIVYLADFCNQVGIDLSLAVANAWDEVKDRDWQKFPTDGKSK